jgi:hypothetical protein
VTNEDQALYDAFKRNKVAIKRNKEQVGILINSVMDYDFENMKHWDKVNLENDIAEQIRNLPRD